MKMTYKEALNVLHAMKSGAITNWKEFEQAVEVMFDNSRKVEHLQTEIGQLKVKIKNKNRIIRTTENHNNRLRNDNEAKKHVLAKRNSQIHKTSETLEDIVDESESFIGYYINEKGENAIAQRNMAGHFGTIAAKALEGLK